MTGIAAAIGAAVDKGALAGAATLVWRGGKVIESAAVGWRNIAAGLPMTRDTIFRIASLTKPVTSVAALMLLEEGRFQLTDPISRWAPEFSAMRVLRSPDGPLDETEPAARPITFEDLLTHRSGLSYSSFRTGPIASAYDAALGGAIDSDVAADHWIKGLAGLPLIAQPGTAFHYGHSTDLLGLLIARMEDAPLGEVFKRRIFAPLGMADTGFTVPRDKKIRRAQMYGFDDAGRLAARPCGALTSGVSGRLMAERPETLTYVSGGAGLWSTVDDYLAFARLFVGEGAVEDVRLLKPQTVALMAANRLSESQRADAKMFGMPIFGIGHGFGLGVAVVLDPQKASALRGRGGVGTVGWPGAYGGWWQADPTNNTVMIFLAHNVIEVDQLMQGIGLDIYATIMEFHALASAFAT